MEKMEITLYGTILAIDENTHQPDQTGLIYPEVSIRIGTKTVLHVGLTPQINNFILDTDTYESILHTAVLFTTYTDHYPTSGEHITPTYMRLAHNITKELSTEPPCTTT